MGEWNGGCDVRGNVGADCWGFRDARTTHNAVVMSNISLLHILPLESRHFTVLKKLVDAKRQCW
jgi:hypothetical protein